METYWNSFINDLWRGVAKGTDGLYYTEGMEDLSPRRLCELFYDWLAARAANGEKIF